MRLAKLKSALRHIPLEAYAIVGLLVGGVFWGVQSNRSFWAGMACTGHLFPTWLSSDPKIKTDLETTADQSEAFTSAARHVGYDASTANLVGEAAATFCNQQDER